MKKIFTKTNLWIMGISLLVIVLLCFMIPPICDTYNAAAASKGVSFCGTSVGGKTEEEISALIDAEIQKTKGISVTVEDKTVALDLNSAGFSIDKEKTLADIMSAGKNNFFDNFVIRWSNRDIAPSVVMDEEMFTTVLKTLLTQEGFQVQRFEFTINENVADIVLSDETHVFDFELLFSEITEQYPDIQDAYQLTKRVAGPLTAAEMAKDINLPVVDARIEVQDGKKVVLPHQTGLQIDEAVLAQMLASGEREFSVPVTVLEPNVRTDELSTDAFPNRLSIFSTEYNEDEVSRSSNVKLAAEKVNGTVLNSGDVFSFNEVVGKRSYENGFKDAKIFLADSVVDGTGGGICQVSSTIYPAALYSDLKIVERKNHNFVVAYAEPGVDATVVYGSIDFKFENSMQNPIKIKAYAENGVMTVEIWGTKENNNTVEITTENLGYYGRGVKYVYNPSLAAGKSIVTQYGYDGQDVRTYRIVKDESGNVIRTDDLGVSNYIPLTKIIQTSNAGLAGTVASTAPSVPQTNEAESEANSTAGESQTTIESENTAATEQIPVGESTQQTSQSPETTTGGDSADTSSSVSQESTQSTQTSQPSVSSQNTEAAPSAESSIPPLAEAPVAAEVE
ncbi:MAG: hypothetical protein E7413_02695 [Ruminococcaceae bacterium]|nr:hypothetical protein [Oscillospiraceae bacterium]